MAILSTNKTASDTKPSITLPDISKSYKNNLVSGLNLDNIYTKKNEELAKLKEENKEFKTENNQYKKLNEKLLDRIDFLQHSY